MSALRAQLADLLIAEIAAGQHGVITVKQLHAIGVDANAIATVSALDASIASTAVSTRSVSRSSPTKETG